MSVPYNGISNKVAVPGVTGTNTAGGDGVKGKGRRGVVGESKDFQGVFGHSEQNAGVVGESDGMHAVFGVTHGAASAGVYGTNDRNDSRAQGVLGESKSGDGVVGRGRRGVVGESKDFQGVFGHSGTNAGVVGESDGMHAVFGITHGGASAGVYGTNDRRDVRAQGVLGESKNGDGVVGRGHRGVVGESREFQGVYGHSEQNAGVVGESSQFDGVFGVSHSAKSAGVSGHNDQGGFAGFFEGKVTVVGSLTVTDDIILTGADCAEEFPVAEGTSEPGTVMVIESEGRLRECREAYDSRVAGVISGAGDTRPGIILGRHFPDANRVPLAMIGKVYCKVDASEVPIGIGDLLTTSATPGHAMKACDRARAFGSIIGKALAPLPAGRGMVPILVAMQ